MSGKELEQMFKLLDIQISKSIKIAYLPHILAFDDSIIHLN